jgi:hypothetical protein
VFGGVGYCFIHLHDKGQERTSKQEKGGIGR